MAGTLLLQALLPCRGNFQKHIAWERGGPLVGSSSTDSYLLPGWCATEVAEAGACGRIALLRSSSREAGAFNGKSWQKTWLYADAWSFSCVVKGTYAMLSHVGRYTVLSLTYVPRGAHDVVYPESARIQSLTADNSAVNEKRLPATQIEARNPR